jgi:hypothetical protein
MMVSACVLPVKDQTKVMKFWICGLFKDLPGKATQTMPQKKIHVAMRAFAGAPTPGMSAIHP